MEQIKFNLLEEIEEHFYRNLNLMDRFKQAQRAAKPASEISLEEAKRWVGIIGIELFLEMVFGKEENNVVFYDMFAAQRKQNEEIYRNYRKFVNENKVGREDFEKYHQNKVLEHYKFELEQVEREVNKIAGGK